MLLHLLVLALVPLLCTEAKSKSATCPIRPYTDVDLNKVHGTWYAVRGIEHNRVKHTSRQRNNKACPVITVTVRDSTHLEFSYDSKNGSEPRQYNMTVRDPAVPSVWTTEKGNKKHVPFGKLQVNDVSDHSMALTMCGTQRLATVILFRFDSFHEEKVDQKKIVGVDLSVCERLTTSLNVQSENYFVNFLFTQPVLYLRELIRTLFTNREKEFSSSTVEAVSQRLAAKGLNSTRTFDRCKT